MGSQGFCSKSVICLACFSLRYFVSSFFARKCFGLYGSSSQGFVRVLRRVRGEGEGHPGREGKAHGCLGLAAALW